MNTKNVHIEVLARVSGLPPAAIALAGAGISSKLRFLRRLADYAEALQGSKPKSSAATVVFLWLSGLADEDDALEALLLLPAGEEWAEMVLGWTDEERAAALEQLEARGWNQSTLEAL